MRIYVCCIVFLSIGLLLLIQESGIIAFQGIKANLILIAMVLIPITSPSFFVFISGAFGLIFFSLFFGTSLILPAFPILFFAFVLRLIKKYFTGNTFYDFLISLFLGTALFYLILHPSDLKSMHWLFMQELIVNLFVGVFVWFLVSDIIKKYETKSIRA